MGSDLIGGKCFCTLCWIDREGFFAKFLFSLLALFMIVGGGVALFGVGWTNGHQRGRDEVREEAVKKGYAIYLDPVPVDNFRWK